MDPNCPNKLLVGSRAQRTSTLGARIGMPVSARAFRAITTVVVGSSSIQFEHAQNIPMLNFLDSLYLPFTFVFSGLPNPSRHKIFCQTD